jgi:hypothetical protein
MAPDLCFPVFARNLSVKPGNKVKEVFSEWEPNHRLLPGNGIVGFENVGGDIDKVTVNVSLLLLSRGDG